MAAQIVSLLTGLRDETAVLPLMVAHDLPMAAHPCNRVVVMVLGQVAEGQPLDPPPGGVSSPFLSNRCRRGTPSHRVSSA